MNLRDYSQELIELGPRAAAFRVNWEIRGRLRSRFPSFGRIAAPAPAAAAPGWTRRLPLADAASVARAMDGRVPASAIQSLRHKAEHACRGRIECFGRFVSDYGMPIDWHLNPGTGRRWPAQGDMRRLAGEAAAVGDIKLTWEAARFPHAYHLARAAAYSPADADRFAAALLAQMAGFRAANPYGAGPHWSSGQETSLRLLAWLFALDALLVRSAHAVEASALVAESLIEGAAFIEANLDYVRLAVNNNHLICEALGLFAAAALLPDAPAADRWRGTGRRILDEEADRQFAADGGYLMLSHNYHRAVLQHFIWACALAKSMGDGPSPAWLRAMERSLDMLQAHLNPGDGRLPNYGANDGSYTSPLSCCDFSDFRPVLQTLALIVRGERMFEAGPWDEMAVWFLGPRVLDAPLRPHRPASRSFAATGFHVLRGRDGGSFAAFRCGSLRDRFTQIDMLHADIWWRGQNVLADAGSFQYNGAPGWHRHFMRTGCHNTIEIDGRDQMLHFRQFKVLYWTKAALLGFADGDRWALAEGEHYGYQRHPGRAVHRRSVLFLKDDVWVIVDTVFGDGAHAARLHWLGGEFEWSALEGADGFWMRTPAGPFAVRILDGAGAALEGTVVAGQESPPRGWLSRYYGSKIAVPSLEVIQEGPAPLTFVSLLAGVPCAVSTDKTRWTLNAAGVSAAFTVADGRISAVEIP